jgi:hypothetical protein
VLEARRDAEQERSAAERARYESAVFVVHLQYSPDCTALFSLHCTVLDWGRESGPKYVYMPA